jgi:hypothetical protein
VSKFVDVVRKHALTKNQKGIHYPYCHCNNERVWLEEDEIKSHLLKWVVLCIKYAKGLCIIIIKIEEFEHTIDVLEAP